MPAKQELFLPSVKEALAASEVVKTATATSAFSKSASIVRDEEGMEISLQSIASNKTVLTQFN